MFYSNVYDVTSTLDLKVYHSSLVNSIRNEPSGNISIPLLRIRNGEMRWYALKDKYKRISGKGNCPRILLEMSLIWNPVSWLCYTNSWHRLAYLTNHNAFMNVANYFTSFPIQHTDASSSCLCHISLSLYRKTTSLTWKAVVNITSTFCE